MLYGWQQHWTKAYVRGHPGFHLQPLDRSREYAFWITGHVGISIFAAGLVLMVMTLVFNMLGHIVRKKYRENY
jgi:hypothetical protein